MKKMILAVILSVSVSANAYVLESLDWALVLRNVMAVAKVINRNLEQVRLYSHANMNIQDEWDLACEATQTLNPSILEFNKLLTKYEVNQKLGCAPITPLIRYQTEIIKQCQAFYGKPVPENAKVMLTKFAFTVFQSKMILTKCYPELAKVKLPIPSFD